MSVNYAAEARKEQVLDIRKSYDDEGTAFLRSPHHGCIASSRIEMNSPRVLKLIEILWLPCRMSALEILKRRRVGVEFDVLRSHKVDHGGWSNHNPSASRATTTKGP